jgi:hypothetical protein
VLYGMRTGEREGEPERGERTEGLHGVQQRLQEVVSAFDGKQEVASAWPCTGHAGAPCVSTKKTSNFAKSPLALGIFPGNFKTEPFCIV